MAALRRVASRFLKRLTEHKPIQGRDLQLRTETHLLYTIANSTYRQNADLSESLAHSAEHIVSRQEEIPFEEQARVVKRYLMSKIIDVLDPMCALKDDDESSIEESVWNSLKYVPKVMESAIPGAGLGVFINGTAKCGSVLGLYPGVCYLPSDMQHLPNFPNVTLDNDYMMWRYDGIIIDGKPPLKEETCAEHIDVSRTSEASLKLAQHPFAQAHRVNHPPKGKLPNCLRFMVNIPMNSLEFQPVRHLIPNKLFKPSTQSRLEWLTNLAARQLVPKVSAFGTISRKSDVIPSLAVVATRDICDEEVFMNYRFNPRAKNIPEWYHDCDPASTKRRWTEVNAFST